MLRKRSIEVDRVAMSGSGTDKNAFFCKKMPVNTHDHNLHTGRGRIGGVHGLFAVEGGGCSLTVYLTVKQLEVSQSTIRRAVERGETIAAELSI